MLFAGVGMREGGEEEGGIGGRLAEGDVRMFRVGGEFNG